MRVQVVCSGGDVKRAAVVAGPWWWQGRGGGRAAAVAGRHMMGQWHTMGWGASNRAAWHTRVQVVRVVVVGSNRAGDPSMWVGDAWVRGMWVRERVARCGQGMGCRWVVMVVGDGPCHV